jgi:hypothetical protein
MGFGSKLQDGLTNLDDPALIVTPHKPAAPHGRLAPLHNAPTLTVAVAPAASAPPLPPAAAMAEDSAKETLPSDGTLVPVVRSRSMNVHERAVI